jgi:hypothetical protein
MRRAAKLAGPGPYRLVQAPATIPKARFSRACRPGKA